MRILKYRRYVYMVTLLSVIVIVAIALIGVGIVALLLDILGAIGVTILLPVSIVGKEFLIVVGGIILYFAWRRTRTK